MGDGSKGSLTSYFAGCKLKRRARSGFDIA
jgi:hypothetical protein